MTNLTYLTLATLAVNIDVGEELAGASSETQPGQKESTMASRPLTFEEAKASDISLDRLIDGLSDLVYEAYLEFDGSDYASVRDRNRIVYAHAIACATIISDSLAIAEVTEANDQPASAEVEFILGRIPQADAIIIAHSL